jgi:hypothetical protein
MNFSKYLKIELSLGEKLKKLWKKQEHLTDDIIEKSLIHILENDERFGILSSINIEVSQKWKENDDIKKALSTLNIPSHPWRVLIIMVHNRPKIHWSCMIYLKEKNVVYHYDSIKKYNRKECIKLFSFLENMQIFNEDTQLYERLFINQESNYECGYFLLICVFLAKRIYDGEDPIDYSQLNENPNYINNILFVLFDILNKFYL